MDDYKLKIKKIRRIKGLTGEALAHKIGITQSYLSDLENQKYDIKLSRLLKIARALEVCPYKLTNICIKCPNDHTLFTCIMVYNKLNDLYDFDYNWGDYSGEEKTVIYIEPQLKKEVKIRLHMSEDNQKFNNLMNMLIKKWLNEQK